MLNDLRYALRILLKSPGFTVVAILTLTLGIGANTAIFTLIHALILRELPVHEPDRLVALSTTTPSGQPSGLSYPMFEDFRLRQTVFSSLLAWSGGGVSTLESNEELWPGTVTSATGDYYSTLGLRPVIGRPIVPEDEGLQGRPASYVAVISYACWRRHYGSDPAVIGKTIRIEGRPYTIVGVTPKDFLSLAVTVSDDVTVPLTASNSVETLRRGKFLWLDLVGRLKQGISLNQARAQLEALWPGVQAATVSPDWSTPQKEESLSYRLKTASAATGAGYIPLRQRFFQPLCLLMCIASLVLVIACANLASLLLARAAARRREMGVRIALGAGGWRLIRQLLVESVLLSIVGAVPGFFFAWWASRLLADFMWTGLVPLGLDLAPDLRILGFTSAVTILTGIGFGLAPAWRGASEDPAEALQQSSRTVGRGTGRLSTLLVSGQIALSLVSLIGAALFGRSLQNLRSLDLGLRRESVLLMQLTEKPGRYRDLNRSAYYRDLTDRLSQLPGVRSVSFSQVMPITPLNYREAVWSKRFASSTPSPVDARPYSVGPRFFETLGIPFLQGRDFEIRDDEHAPRVAIVSKELAQKLFPSTEAVGQRIRIGSTPETQDLQIIGVVGEVNLVSRENRRSPAAYLSYFQDQYNWPMVEVRTSGDPLRLATSVRREIEALGREYPLRTLTLQQEVERLLLPERVMAMLSEIFGGIALLLACVGLYGLMSYAVARRTSEIGIRIALGAEAKNVHWLVLRETLLLVSIGVVIGVPVTLASTRLISGMLFGLTPNDPATIAIATLSLVIVALVAGYLPARRAARVDPMVALRHE